MSPFFGTGPPVVAVISSVVVRCSVCLFLKGVKIRGDTRFYLGKHVAFVYKGTCTCYVSFGA